MSTKFNKLTGGFSLQIGAGDTQTFTGAAVNLEPAGDRIYVTINRIVHTIIMADVIEINGTPQCGPGINVGITAADICSLLLPVVSTSAFDYKKYTAKLYQSGTNPLYDIQLGRNDFTSLPQYSRTGVGQYTVYLEAAFAQRELLRFIHAGLTADGKRVAATWIDDSSFSIAVTTSAGAAVEAGFDNYDFEIQVFDTNEWHD